MTHLAEQPALDKQTFYDTVQNTPLIQIDGNFAGAEVFIKDDTQQAVGSFKIRGALHAALQLDTEAQQAGLVTASAGNHGQGVALAAQLLGCPVQVFVPEATPEAKLSALTNYGADVVKVSGTVDSALLVAQEQAARSGASFIHPFDNTDVIQGQATLTEEVLASQTPDALFVPVGGGGLLAGACQAVDTTGAHTQVFGVQLEGADAFAKSVEAGEVIELGNVNTLSDGTAVRQAGVITLQRTLDSSAFAGIITVTEADLGEAMVLQELATGVAAEPAGSLAFAGMKRLARARTSAVGETWTAVMSGRHRDPVRFKKLLRATGYNACGKLV